MVVVPHWFNNLEKYVYKQITGSKVLNMCVLFERLCVKTFNFSIKLTLLFLFVFQANSLIYLTCHRRVLFYLVYCMFILQNCNGCLIKYFKNCMQAKDIILYNYFHAFSVKLLRFVSLELGLYVLSFDHFRLSNGAIEIRSIVLILEINK